MVLKAEVLRIHNIKNALIDELSEWKNKYG